METGLRLLMSDGAIHVTFQPRLTAEQYADLVQLTEKPETTDELREALKEFALHWAIKVTCDE